MIGSLSLIFKWDFRDNDIEGNLSTFLIKKSIKKNLYNILIDDLNDEVSEMTSHSTIDLSVMRENISSRLIEEPLAENTKGHRNLIDHSLASADLPNRYYIAANESSEDADNIWCNHLRNSPAPKFLMYNRIPKTGSTTMQDLFESICKQNGKCKVYHMDRVALEKYNGFWNLSNSQEHRRSFLNHVNKYANENPRKFLIFDGHWAKVTFSKIELKGKLAEYINLLRECESHIRSKFYHGLTGRNTKLSDLVGTHLLNQFSLIEKHVLSILLFRNLEIVNECT